MKQLEVSRATMGRVPTYLHHLKNTHQNTENISATTLAKELGLGEVQVRKDLAAVCGEGKPRTGYNVGKLTASLEAFLSFDRTGSVALVGAGNLGRALLDYGGFKDYGLEIAAAFDADVTETQYSNSRKPIYSMDMFDSFCAENNVKIGVIAVPSKNAQEVCDRFIKNGVRAIWCFAPCVLSVPDDFPVQYENMALSLAFLNKKI